ncbi:TPA: antitermination protein Q [Yersinia enterocolitica]|uniref:antiterminator Q family protein n=1 Tax=Yersinia TaxID=629 RepID=UPI00119F1B95|nr:antiterminator Q family protein [Yersinia intermedia]EKN3986070.1 antitermination protein Q [Yersinia enterocolitica]ELW7390529.1 antitermination protein Q [Yersinia enterocolitica]ELW8977045.1 antitermination protein Q [Yersinia enterocolitica]HDL6612910.1 antitermination protein Q [Yersinia enterocolitica]HEI6919538.1 antitermination protein Q [Yersinia enterocolitica]
MRDISLVLARWGVWARDNSGTDYSSIAAGFKGLLPVTASRKESCCDDDGLIVDAAVGQLKARRLTHEYSLICLHYILGVSKRQIAKRYKVSEGRVRQQMQVAEGFVDGCLAMTGAVLEMDPYTQIQHIHENDKKGLVRYA